MNPQRPNRLVLAARRLCVLALLAFAIGIAAIPDAHAASLQEGNFYWYVLEHEKYSRTQFYSAPSFESPTVGITRSQRFVLLRLRRGWALLEFDSGIKAYAHIRLLRYALYDPSASDPWYEFQRASVFAEDPARIADRLQTPESQRKAIDSAKTPVWKRYKDGWSINKGRAPVATDSGEGYGGMSEPAEKKARRKSLLEPKPVNPEPRDSTADEPRAAPSR